MSSEFSVPEIPISKELIERVLFSVSSRNAEAKVSECATHVFASRYVEDPHEIQWQYITSGVTCILRNRELAKNGRKYVWAMNLCLYNATYGVLVWKGKLSSVCGYTAVSDNFHVFSMSEVDGVVGLLFSDREQALDIHRNYLAWHQERVREEKSKGGTFTPPNQIRFRKEMISKPCNFQHIQGTQALDECLEIERIKTEVQAAFFGLGPRITSRNETDSSASRKSGGKKKKEVVKPRLEFGQLATPHTNTDSAAVVQPFSPPPPMEQQAAGYEPVGHDVPYQPPYMSPPPPQEPAYFSPPPPPSQEPAYFSPPPPQQSVYFSPPPPPPPPSQQLAFAIPPPPLPPLKQQDSRQSLEPPQGAPLSNPASEGGASYYDSSRGSYHSSSRGSYHGSHVTSPGPTSPYSITNGYPQPQDTATNSYQPPTRQDVDERNGYYGNEGGYHGNYGGYYGNETGQGSSAQPGYVDADLSVDAEVEQYMQSNASNGSFGEDFAPPPRLSPLTLEDDFFASALMSTH